MKLAAGVAQEVSDMKTMGLIKADLKAFNSFLNCNYFDNPGDSKMIQDGIDDFKSKHRK